LEAAKGNRQDTTRLEAAGEQVTAGVNNIVSFLRKYPRQMELTLHGKGSDFDNQAEKELIKCTQTIEESIKRLEGLRPNTNKPSTIDEANNSLVEAAVGASKATLILTQQSILAQRERAKKGSSDPILINGILSAAGGVSSSVMGLVGSTSSTIKSKGVNGEEEAIITSANSIATTTNHLFSASKAKADPNSQVQKNLQQAAKHVAQATAKLVAAAQSYTVLVESAAIEEAEIGGGMSKELEFQIKILQLEKELQRERKRQDMMRAQKFNSGM